MAPAQSVSDAAQGWLSISTLANDLKRTQQIHVPTQVMLDYAYGGLDDELLKALYGNHIRSCPSCQEGVEVYGRQRPSDPARLGEVPEFSFATPVSESYCLTPKEAGKRFRDFLARDSGPLWIVAGEANPEVYDAETGATILRRARLARAAGAGIPRIICGPVMGLNEQIRRPEDTILPCLAEDGAIQLYQARHRQCFHFRVSGTDSVYAEEYHEAGNPGDRHGYWYRSRSVAALFRRRFDAILQAGLAQEAAREDFVYLPMEKIREIQRAEGACFDRMTSEQLRQYA
jgi:hypothetical protein